MEYSDSYKEEESCHDLVRGDHIMRWSNILIYPVQVSNMGFRLNDVRYCLLIVSQVFLHGCSGHIRKVHGIVLSASSDIITIVDFGLTATKSQKNNKISESENLEDMVNQEDKAMVDACEQYRKDNVGKERINILTLSGEKEINRWKKVNYGEELKKQKDWRWWKKSDDRTSTIDDEKNAMCEVDNHLTKGVDSKIIEKEEAVHEASEISKLDETQNKDLLTKRPTKWWKGCKTHDKDDEDRDKPTKEVEQQLEKNHKVPTLPKSDPEHLVLSRVRYLLHNPAELPPHNILFSNSECIAVWCKTGQFSYLANKCVTCSRKRAYNYSNHQADGAHCKLQYFCTPPQQVI